jgi:hypothetical protein
MIDYSESKVVHLSAHVVGNGVNGEKLKLSSEPLEIDDDHLQELLLTYFLSNFTQPEYYAFTSDDGLPAGNPVFKMASHIFSNPQSLHKTSINIAGHLLRPHFFPGLSLAIYMSLIFPTSSLKTTA